MHDWFKERASNAMVLDVSMEVYRKKFKSLIGYQILFSLISILMIIAGGVIIFPMLRWISIDGVFGFTFFIVTMIMVMGCFICLSYAGIFHMTYGYINGENMTAGNALSKAFSSFGKIFRIVGALAISSIPIIVVMGILGVTTTSITLLQNKMTSSIGFSLFINVVVYTSILAIIGSYLFYSLHIAIFDSENGFKSMKKSIRFAKGEVFKNTFRVLSISIFDWGVNLSVYSAIVAISGLGYFLFGKVQGGESLVSQVIVYGNITRPIINGILGIVISPISSIIWTTYYVNMKYKKEGFKIYNMIDHLELKQSEESPKKLDLHLE